MLKPEYLRPENENALYNAGLLILQSSNRREEARALKFFEAAIEFNPMRDGTNFNIALIRDNMGDYAEAINYYERTIKVSKNTQIVSAAYTNLVGLYIRLEMLDEAAKACQRAIETNPKDASAWSNLGVIMRQEQNEDLSKTCFEHALQVSDGIDVVALSNLGSIFQRDGDLDKAEEYFKKVCNLDPSDDSSLYSLACVMRDKGRMPTAILLLQECINLNPNHSQAPFLLDALLGATPKIAPPNYVADLFDHYARSGYENHMVSTLQYKVPSLLNDAVLKAVKLMPENADLASRLCQGRVVDLGVGTGLCSKQLKSSGLCGDATFTGCDLSQSMVSAALQKEIRGVPLFREVAVGDCCAYLSTLDSDSVDLIVAGDVMVYIGDVGNIFTQVKRVLNKSSVDSRGLFAFTVEARKQGEVLEKIDNADLNINEDYVLHKDMRYAHSKAYLHRVAEASGMKVLVCDEELLRLQDARPVRGYVVVCSVD
jgi:predicted TPR repeat methyltransferase